MTPFEILGFESNMPRLEAARTLDRAKRGEARLSVDQVYDLTLAETENEGQASKAASGYAAALLRAGLKPE